MRRKVQSDGSQLRSEPTCESPSERQALIPLSFEQKRIWKLLRTKGLSFEYNVSLTIRVSNAVDICALESALCDVMERHEILRTYYPEIMGCPYQKIEPLVSRRVLQIIAISEEFPSDQFEASRACEFDLTTESPFRALLFKSGQPGKVDSLPSLLLIVTHRIAVDAWSIDPIVRDLCSAYTARRAGEMPKMPQLPIRYSEYSIWQRETLGDRFDAKSLMARNLGFWISTLNDLPEEGELLGRLRKKDSSRHASTIPIRINPPVHKDLLFLAQRMNVSLLMLLQACLVTLFAGISEGNDPPIGILLSGRANRSWERLVGVFTNILVFRTKTCGDPSFRNVVRKVQKDHHRGRKHQHLPFGSLLDALGPMRSRSLEQVILCLRSRCDLMPDQIGNAGSDLIPVAADFELMFDLIEIRASNGSPAGIEGRVAYRHYTSDYIIALLDRLLIIIKSATRDPDQRISALHREVCQLTQQVNLSSPVDDCRSTSDRINHESEEAVVNDCELSPLEDVLACSRLDRREWQQAYVSPWTSLQRRLVETLEESFGVERIGIRDRFVELGGDAVLAKQIAQIIEKRYGMPLQLSMTPWITVEQMSILMLQQLPIVPIIEVRRNNAESRNPFFFLHGDVFGGWYAFELAQRLTSDWPLYILPPHGINGRAVPKSVEEMARDHVSTLQKYRPLGPYYLGGYCSGALVAFEMARLLLELHYDVPLLILVEPPPKIGEQTLDSNSNTTPTPTLMSGGGGIMRERATTAGEIIRACTGFSPKPYPGCLTILLGRTGLNKAWDCEAIWRKVAAKVDVHFVPGDHYTCITRHVVDLAVKLEQCMKSVDTSQPG
jgi:hypothetical protein